MKHPYYKKPFWVAVVFSLSIFAMSVIGIAVLEHHKQSVLYREAGCYEAASLNTCK